LLIQQNVNAFTYRKYDFFNGSWAEFKVGFNDSEGHYWLGNELLSQLTANNTYKLRFDLLSLHTSNWSYAEYSTFRVLTEADNYTLVVDGYSGNAGDSFGKHNGTMFSTYDRDNDGLPTICVRDYRGGFWHGVGETCGWCSTTGTNMWTTLPGSPRSPPIIDEYRQLQCSRTWLQCK